MLAEMAWHEQTLLHTRAAQHRRPPIRLEEMYDMASRREFLAISLGASSMLVLGSHLTATAAAAQEEHLTGATAITQVFGDGQRLTAVALQYDQDIDSAALSPASFTVQGRTITGVYANTQPNLAPQGTNGRYVILELSPDDSSAQLWGTGQLQGGPPTDTATSATPASTDVTTATTSRTPASTTATPSSDTSGAQTTPPAGSAGMPQAGQAGPEPTITSAVATVTQVQAISAADGTTYPPGSSSVQTSRVVNLIVDDFQQFTFNDPATGNTLSYNLYIPQDYDLSKSYPLVVFMPDSSVVSTQTIAPLVQGLGAVSWASPEDQAKRTCFVLAPNYPVVVIDDNYQPISLFDTTVNLVKALPQQYKIDTTRLYATGQSMGAMMTLGMNIKYPGLFAASLVVAGQWEPASDATPLANEKLWVVVSQGDDKAYPDENAIMDVIQGQGTPITTASWDGSLPVDQLDAAAGAMAEAGTPINYASFIPGTVLPANGSDTSEHRNTWRVAYTIDALRDWIFQQHL